MTFGQKLKAARVAMGFSQQEAAQALGVDKTTYSGYETGRRQPDLARLRRLCQLLESSADQLLGLAPPAPVTLQELQSIRKYRTLDIHGKRVVDGALELEYDRMTHVVEQEQKGAVTYINCYDLAVSAGPGEPWADDAGYKTRIEIPTEQVPEDAHYCARVNGDSMEPAYKDGDIVFVKRQDEMVRVGEIGIFSLNGEGYIKRMGQGCLESLNPRYGPIPLHSYDDLRCQGRVLGKPSL